ncbi:MAG TPA: hypothetical protein PKA27_17585 [Fimbriimonadaceae bacterium]|nr:hypothetical protein [Fimbriimonadaceae bacterium]
MTRWAKLLFGVAGLALLLGAATFFVEKSYADKAVLVQRVQIDSAASGLFGESEPTPIGSPQLMIIDDPKAFLTSGDPNGARLVDDAYLQEKGIYPLQLKTVEFTAGTVRLAAFGIGGLLAVLGWFAGRRRARKPEPSSNPV